MKAVFNSLATRRKSQFRDRQLLHHAMYLVRHGCYRDSCFCPAEVDKYRKKRCMLGKIFSNERRIFDQARHTPVAANALTGLNVVANGVRSKWVKTNIVTTPFFNWSMSKAWRNQSSNSNIVALMIKIIADAKLSISYIPKLSLTITNLSPLWSRAKHYLPSHPDSKTKQR